MATFTSGASAGDMRYLFAWMQPARHWQGVVTAPIETIGAVDTTHEAITNTTALGATLTLNYTGSGFAAAGNVPTGGTYASVDILFGGVDFGVLDNFGTANFADADGGGTTSPYALLSGSDTLNGSAGSDVLFGGYGGNDTFIGNGHGTEDRFVAGVQSGLPVHSFLGSSNAGVDTIEVIRNPDSFIQTLNFSASTFFSIDALNLEEGVQVNLLSSQIDAVANSSGAIAHNLQLSRIAAGNDAVVVIGKDTADTLDLSSWQVSGVSVNVSGSAQDDMIIATAGANALIGDLGNDTLDGRGGIDTLSGGPGNDTFIFNRGYVTTINDFRSRYFTVVLTGAEETPPVITAAGGTGNFVLDGNQTSMRALLSAGSLSSAASGAWIHSGPPGTSGVAVFDFNAPAATSFALFPVWTTGLQASVADLIGGNLYVNVTTLLHPGGEIRGQILPNAADQGADRIDVTALRMGSFSTLQDLFSDDGSGGAKLEIKSNGITSSLTLIGMSPASLAAEHFILSSNTANDIGNGTNNADDMFGAGGNDVLNGSGGNDRLYGEDGNDTLNGGAGNDRMAGGTGNDIYYVDSLSDVVKELSGAANGTQDTIVSTVNIRLDTTTTAQGIEHVVLQSATNATVVGTSTYNIITGNSGNNYLAGYNGNDTINGKDGNDTIFGGDGKDTLTGGLGNDKFLYSFIADSGGTQPRRDVITDFSQVDLTNDDWIDLSATDANDAGAGNGTFTFIGTAAFSGAVGELRYFQDVANNRTIIEGNTRVDAGSPGAEFSIELTGLYTLTAGATNAFDIIL